VLDALEQAIHKLRPVHRSALPKPIKPLVGCVGDSYDNALAKTINGFYKDEVIHRRGPLRYFEAVEYATLKWVDWFSNRRLLEPIGNIPPAAAEELYYATSPWLRNLNQMASGRPGAVHFCRSASLRRATGVCATTSATEHNINARIFVT